MAFTNIILFIARKASSDVNLLLLPRTPMPTMIALSSKAHSWIGLLLIELITLQSTIQILEVEIEQEQHSIDSLSCSVNTLEQWSRGRGATTSPHPIFQKGDLAPVCPVPPPHRLSKTQG